MTWDSFPGTDNLTLKLLAWHLGALRLTDIWIYTRARELGDSLVYPVCRFAQGKECCVPVRLVQGLSGTWG